MNKQKKTKRTQRNRRRIRVRARIKGTAVRPRLNVFRSLRGTYVQLIDDEKNKTLASVNSKKDAADIKTAGDRKAKEAVAFVLGKKIAEKAKALKINTIVFDRAGYAYHGRVKAVADGAREGGLIF
jgi:large subunit ribosomal protein L18